MMVDLELLRGALGDLTLSVSELKELGRALERPPRAAVRLRPGIEPEQLPFAVEAVPWFPNGFVVVGRARPGQWLQYAAGNYYIQDAASLLAVALVDAKRGQCVCDLCAAPGGKATAILEQLGSGGWLLANEPIGSRLGPLKFNLDRHGATRFAISQLDPRRLADALGPVFDAVLVDAPCTGQALVALGKRSAASFSSRQIGHSAARQARILDAAARLVRPAGRLVYSTCTFSTQENEAQVQRLLESPHGWQVEPEPALARWQSSLLAGAYRLWPHRDGCAGAFAARLVKGQLAAEAAPCAAARPPRAAEAPLPPRLSDWGRLEGARVYAAGSRRFAWPEPPDGRVLAVARLGPEIAFRKGATWFPSYALAMRRDPNWRPRRAVALDASGAADYLAGHGLPCAGRGWMVATWNGRPLGWLKGDGRMAKNHLPKAARLRIRRPDG